MLLFRDISQKAALNIAKLLDIETYIYSLKVIDITLEKIREEDMDEFSMVLMRDLGERASVKDYEFEYRVSHYIRKNANSIRTNPELIKAVKENPDLFPSIFPIQIPSVPFRILKNNVGSEFIDRFREEEWLKCVEKGLEKWNP